MKKISAQKTYEKKSAKKIVHKIYTPKKNNAQKKSVKKNSAQNSSAKKKKKQCTKKS